MSRSDSLEKAQRDTEVKKFEAEALLAGKFGEKHLGALFYCQRSGSFSMSCSMRWAMLRALGSHGARADCG